MFETDRQDGGYWREGTATSNMHRGSGDASLDILLREAVSQSAEGICVCNTDGQIQFANVAFEKMVGMAEGSAAGKEFPLERAAGSDAGHLRQMRENIRHGRQWSGQWALHRPDETSIILESTFSPVRNSQGEVSHCVSVHHDMTRETELAEKLRKAQKMEAVGRLAGGVAHDFNNLLTAVMANAQILRMHLTSDPLLSTKAKQVLRASKRAAELTSKLMGFARAGNCQRVPVDLHDLISDLAQEFVRDRKDTLDICMELRAQPSRIMGDPVHLRQSLLNLALNACEAMEEGGILTFTTRCVRVGADSDLRYELDLIPGKYLCASVVDTGRGMDEATQAHLFEPFFTTKDQSEGAGLGLAGVYGCMRSHNGSVRVLSAPGKGTAVELYLPTQPPFNQVEDMTEPEAAKDQEAAGAVMVVDDEASIREMISDVLQPMGYRVYTFSGGAEAVEFFREHHKEIGLVILDLIMPRMDGRQTFQKLKEIDPEIHALISTGYGTSEMAKRVIADGVRDFLAKPYRLDELSDMVQQHLRKPQ